MKLIIRMGTAFSAQGPMKQFKCDVCGCEWYSNEYEEDWNIHSIPAYDKCPTCHIEIYAKGTFKHDDSHSHIRKV